MFPCTPVWLYCANLFQNWNQKSFIVCLHTQGIGLDDRSVQCRRKYRHSADIQDSADIHRNNTVGMEYNTNIRKKLKLNNVLYPLYYMFK